jgi:hypothetical protein
LVVVEQEDWALHLLEQVAVEMVELEMVELELQVEQVEQDFLYCLITL